MKILGKDVYIGTKNVCVEYTSRLIGNSTYKGETLEENIIFIKDKHNYYIDVLDTEGMEFLAINMFGAATRWKTSPDKVGEKYISDIKPYFNEINQDKLHHIKTLIELAKSIKNNLKNNSDLEI